MPSFLRTPLGIAVAVIGTAFLLSPALVFTFMATRDDDTKRAVSGGVAATVAGREISVAKVERGLEQYAAQLSQSGQTLPAPDSEEGKTIHREVVATLVQREIFEAEAKRCGADCVISEKAIDAELAKIIKANFSNDKTQFQDFLTKAKLTQAEAREEVRSGLLQGALRDHFGGKATATAKDAQAYYDQHTAEFMLPEQRNVRHILVKDKATADTLRARIEAGEDFAKIAKASSIDTGSAKQGGDLGVYQPGQFVPAFDKTAAALADGELSQPVKTQFGYHLIEATITKARTQSFDEVKTSLVKRMRDEQINKRLVEWQKEVSDRYEDKVTYADRDDDPKNAPMPEPADGTPAPQGTSGGTQP